MTRSVPVDGSVDSYLPERIATILLRSQHANLVSNQLSTRINYLLEIASLHTRTELLGQAGLGRHGVLRIEKWLTFHGRRLRRNEESLDSVICGFGFRRSFFEDKSDRTGLASVISPEARDRVLREFGAYSVRAKAPSGRRLAMSESN